MVPKLAGNAEIIKLEKKKKVEVNLDRESELGDYGLHNKHSSSALQLILASDCVVTFDMETCVIDLH